MQTGKIVALIMGIAFGLMNCLTAGAQSDAQAQDAAHNEKLDEAFSRGNPHLVETVNGGLDVDPAQYGAVIGSLSPTGKTALLWNDEEMAAYAVNGDHVTLVAPSDTRGVEDTYGSMASMFKGGLFRSWVGREGVTWSHDGRYAVITSFEMAYQKMKYHDPLIIDTTTGEAFIPATCPKQMFKEDGAATAGSTCFSLDDQYLYFCQYGKAQEYLYSILRYNLESGEITLCWTGEDDIYDPHLYEMPGGSLIMLNTPAKVKQEYGICEFVPGEDGYTENLISSGLSVTSCGAWPRELLYSANSGYAVSRMESAGFTTDGRNIFFQCFRPEQDFEGYRSLFAIPTDGGEIVKIVNTDMETIAEKDRIFSYYAINYIRQSPDGYYALVVGGNAMDDSKKLLLINLETMSYEEVGGLDAASINFLPTVRCPVIEWNSENLLIHTRDGLKTFIIE